MKKPRLDINVSKLKNKILHGDGEATWPIKNSIILIVVLGMTAFLSQFSSGSVEKAENSPENFHLDMLIPESESLVPIQVSNYESLDQLIGQYGVVDLLSNPLNPNEKPKRVAYAVKLVRSRKNSRHFSVLVPADQAHKLAGHHGEFTVIVRNPKLLGTKIVKKKQHKARRAITYETE